MLLEPSVYRLAAKDSLGKARKPGQVILLHTGAILLLSLILAAADYFLDQQIGATGGLSGMGTRSMLSTVQSVLRLAQLVLLPFWQIGSTYYTLQIARQESAGIPSLMEGFRRFGPVLRLKALVAAMAALLGLLSTYVASALFLLTPLAIPLMAETEALLQSNADDAAIMEALIPLLEANTVPILILFSLCFLAGSIFLFFRFRLAELWLMDHPEGGALAALHTSRRMMQGNMKAMLRIDLSYWWYYLLAALVSALAMGDVILDSIGLELTTDAFFSHYLLFFGLYAWAHLALYWWKQNEVSVTYAHAYLSLCPREEPQEAAKM